MISENGNVQENVAIIHHLVLVLIFRRIPYAVFKHSTSSHTGVRFKLPVLDTDWRHKIIPGIAGRKLAEVSSVCAVIRLQAASYEQLSAAQGTRRAYAESRALKPYSRSAFRRILAGSAASLPRFARQS